MRFYEFARLLREEADTASDDNLISVLTHLQYRMSKEGGDTPVTKDTVINLVRNSGNPSFTENDLKQAWENSIAVRNMIQEPSQDEKTITFNKDSDSQGMDELGLDQLGGTMPPDTGMPPDMGMAPNMGMPGAEGDLAQPGLVGSDTSTMPASSGGAPAGPTGDRQTVSQMADRALKRRNK
ncbi:MAG: hypothetical protein RLZZ196_3493 [Bacteroidota bacterium]|jgi:hypothetical protein